ncbi:MAG: protein kinase [Planctomycetota bacterium]|nr:protein kinase [Planctomycetota bacterium]
MQQEQQPNENDARADSTGSSPETNPPATTNPEGTDAAAEPAMSDKTVNLSEPPSDPGSDKTVNLGQVPSPPASDKTVNLGDPPSDPGSDKTVNLGQVPSAPSSDKTVNISQPPRGMASDKTVDLGQTAGGMTGDATVNLGQTVDAQVANVTHRGGTTVKATAVSDVADSGREIVELPGDGTVQKGSATTQPGDAAGAREPPRSLVIQTRQVRDDRDDGTADVSGADYILEKQIGKGGMGLVVRAHQSSVGRKVALKSMLPEYADAGGERVKFVTEAVVTAAMDHPNVVPIYDLGVNEDGSLFYVMKEIEGTPWNDCIGEKSLSENLDILLRMADAMAYAHARAYIHRDLKPENIMVGEFGEVLVMDWGLAVSVHEPESWNLAGTPAYMAPEMASHPVDGLGFGSDIYLMGAILFEILTGSPVHAGASVMDCVRNAARNQIVDTDVDNELMTIARRAMATEIGDRYASIVDFQQAIREYQTHAESVSMSDRAAEQLVLARQNDDYEAYAQARFGFHEATTIWSENEQAQVGQREALVEHAECALEKEDFGLGLSLLAEFQDAPAELLRNLQRGQNQRQRAQTVKRVMVGLLMLAVVAATVALIFARFENIRATQQETLAKQNAAKAEKNADDAQQAQIEAQENETKAVNAARETQNQATAAQAAEKKAQKNALAAERSAAEAKANAYRATVGQVAALIEDNEFETARRRLDELRRSSTERGWEWSRLSYLTSLAVVEERLGNPLVAVAWSTSGNLAVADTSGVVTLLAEAELGEAKGERDLQLQRPDASTRFGVRDLAFSPNGEKLVVVGQRAREQGVIEIWDVASRQVVPTTLEPITTAVTTCRYLETGSGDCLLIGTAGGQVGCLRLQGNALVKLGNAEYGGAVQKLVIVERTAPAQGLTREPPLVVVCGADGVALWEFIDQGVPGRFRSLGKFREHTGRVAAVAAIGIELSGRQPDVLIASAGVDRSGVGQVLLWTLSDWREMLTREQTLSGLALRPPDAATAVPVVPSQETGSQPQLLRLSVATEMRSLALKWRNPGRNADGESKSLHLLLAGGENTLQDRTLEIHARSAVVSDVQDEAADWKTTGKGTWAIEETSQQLLRGHEKPLAQALFDPRNERWRPVVTISGDGSLKKWDLANYYEERVARLLQSEQAIFSSTAVVGERVFAATQTGHLWEWPYLETADQPERHFEGHQFLARNVALFQRGPEQFLLTTSRDQSANLWNLGTGSQVRYWERFCGPLGLVAVSADGSQLITDAPSRGIEKVGGADNARDDDQRTRSFPIYRWRMAARGAAPNGADGTQLVQGPELLQTPHTARIIDIAFSPDSQHFATADADGLVYLWNSDRVAEASPMHSIPGANQPIGSIDDICFYDADTLILALSNGTLHEYQVSGGKFLRIVPRPRNVDSDGWEVARVQLAVGPQSDRMAAQITEVREVATDPQGEVPQAQQFVYRYSLWSWSGARSAAVLVAPAEEWFATPPGGISYSPTGDLVATVQGPRFRAAAQTGFAGQTLRVWPLVDSGVHDRREFRLQRMRAGTPTVESLVFLDNSRLVTVGRRSAIGWRIPLAEQGHEEGRQQAKQVSATEEFALEPQGAAHAIAASPDGQLLVTANEEGTATLWEAAAARVVGRLEPLPATRGARLASIRAVAFAKPHVAGQPYQLAAGDSAGRLTIWKVGADRTVENWRVSWPANDHVEGVTALAWRDQRLVVGTSGGSIYLFDSPQLISNDAGTGNVLELTEGDELVPERSDLTQRVTALVFDPSGEYLAVAQEMVDQVSQSQTRLRIYKIEKRQQEKTKMVLYQSLQGHSQAINCAAFLGRGPGSRLATGSRDGSVKIWQWNYTETAQGKETGTPSMATQQGVNELLSLKAHQGAVSSLNFSEEKNALISSGSDGRIIVWEAARPGSGDVD